MAQLRLTKKFANDLGISKLADPSFNLSIFDDWFIDVIRIDRKKVALVTHARSYLSFLIPYAHVGGAKNIPLMIKKHLSNFVCDNGLPESITEIEKVFDQSFIFSKTKDRRILGHMNDFKNAIEAYTHVLSFEKIEWNGFQICLNNTLAGDSRGNYDRPIDLMLKLIMSENSISLA